MTTRAWLTAMVTVGALALGGCGRGDDSATDPGGSDGSGGASIEHPTGADEVVLRIVTAGGYVPSDYVFRTVPQVLITGDGTVYSLPATDEDPTRMPALETGRMSEEQLQELLGEADAAGLLDDAPDYADDQPQVTDMGTTSVSLSADGATFEHAAYALGFENESGVRKVLADFVTESTRAVGAVDQTTFVPQRARLTADPADPASATAPSVNETAWPDVSVDLSGVGECTEVPAAGFASALTDASLQTYFTQGGQAYLVSGAPVLPGDEGCTGTS